MSSVYHYIRLQVSPPNDDSFAVRKAISDALTQAFGLTACGTYLDILSVAENGSECVLRVNPADISRILASVISWNEAPRFSLIKESPFLPSLLCDGSLENQTA